MINLEEISISELNLRLKNKVALQRVPYEATLELTYGCNLKCIHCYNPTHKSSPDELSASELFSIFDQLAEAGCMLLLFSGGEPFIRRDLFEILSCARKKGFQLVLNTNATMLDDERIHKLEELGLNMISVSVFGMTEKTYESVTGIRGSFAHFRKGIDLLISSDLPLFFKMPILRLNQHELTMAREWFDSRQLRFVHSVEIHPRTDGNLAPLDYRLPEAEAARLRLDFDDELRCTHRDSIKAASAKREIFSCQCGKGSFALTPFGEMNLCVSTYYPKYSLRIGNLKEGWKMLVKFVTDFQPSELYECRQCELAAYCSQGPMDAFLNRGDFNPCLPYFKNVAKIIAASES